MAAAASALDRLESNLREVRNIFSAHAAARGGGPRIEVLNRSAVVLLHACYDAFVWDLLEEVGDEKRALTAEKYRRGDERKYPGPSPESIDQVYKTVLGIEPAKTWVSDPAELAAVKARLAGFRALRNDIAHNLRSERYLAELATCAVEELVDFVEALCRRHARVVSDLMNLPVHDDTEARLRRLAVAERGLPEKVPGSVA